MRCGARCSPWQHGRRRTTLILAVLLTTLQVAGFRAFPVAGFRSLRVAGFGAFRVAGLDH